MLIRHRWLSLYIERAIEALEPVFQAKGANEMHDKRQKRESTQHHVIYFRQHRASFLAYFIIYSALFCLSFLIMHLNRAILLALALVGLGASASQIGEGNQAKPRLLDASIFSSKHSKFMPLIALVFLKKCSSPFLRLQLFFS